MHKIAKITLSLMISTLLFSSSNMLSYAALGDEVLKIGMTSEDIKELQVNLNKLGYFDKKYTGYFGTDTEASVKKFQASVGLEADGKVGKTTVEYLKKSASKKEKAVVKEPAKKTEAKVTTAKLEFSVKTLQIDLVALGYYDGTIDSDLGPGTQAAIKKYQKDHDLKADGNVDQALLDKIKSSVAKKEPSKTATKTAKATSVGRALVDKSRQYLGLPYVWGASSGSAFDCSGYTRYVMKKFGVTLPHSSSGQYALGSKVAKADLQMGDLVFFSTSRSKVGHVGIYIGDGKFIHASSSNNKVMISNLNSYGDPYVGAKRFNIKLK